MEDIYKEKMCQLAEKLKAENFTADDIIKLVQFGNLRGIKQVLNGYAEIVPIGHVVDCDVVPEIFSCWGIEEHRKMGKVKLENRDGKLYANNKEVIRFLSEKQRGWKSTEGKRLRLELEGKPTLNACILDYLLKYPEIIPEEWKTGFTYFWGTIFRRWDDKLYVAYINWGGNVWNWSFNWLDYDWFDNCLAACLGKTSS